MLKKVCVCGVALMVAGSAAWAQTTDVSVAKTVDVPNPWMGAQVTFTVIVSNEGPAAATGIVVNDSIPVRLGSAQTTPSTGTYQFGQWLLGGLAAGAAETMTITGAALGYGAITNTATISYLDQTDSNGANDTSTAVTTPRRTPCADYDGDGTSDTALFLQPSANWYIMRSTTGFWQPQFGWSEVTPLPGDYDGDGKTDLACYHQPSGWWFLMQTTAGFWSGQFGWSEADPVPGDYDGDGLTDLAVYHQAAGQWYIMGSRLGFTTFVFGYHAVTPVPGDYDGDGWTDPAVYLASTAQWFLLQSTAGFAQRQFGWEATSPCPADYDGDDVTDLGAYHGETGDFYILPSGGAFDVDTVGPANANPVRGDFDGNGADDRVVYVADGGNWHILYDGGGTEQRQFGYREVYPVCGRGAAETWDGEAPIPGLVDLWLPFDQDWVVEAEMLNCHAGVWDRYYRNNGPGGVDWMTGRPEGMMLRLANGFVYWTANVRKGSVNHPYPPAGLEDHVAGTELRWTFSGNHMMRFEYRLSDDARPNYGRAHFFWDGEHIGDWEFAVVINPGPMTQWIVENMGGGTIRWYVGNFQTQVP